jgi:antitoxin YefM
MYGGDIMSYTTNITNARKDLYKLAEMVIENGAEIHINTKNGNVIMISEDEYRSLLETLHLSSNETYKKSIIDGLETTYEQTIAEDKVKW